MLNESLPSARHRHKKLPLYFKASREAASDIQIQLVPVPLPSQYFLSPYFFLEVTQNAIRANEKPANSIMEANENGDSALKAGWAHGPNKPSSVTASLHLN